MQKINKTGSMPAQTSAELKKYKGENWGSIPETVKAPLREQLLAEQKGLCCYCCQNIAGKPTHIEHLKCRQYYPELTFDYANLLLSCNTPKQCDNAKGNQELTLHPLMDECDTEIKLNLAGELVTSSQRAQDALGILNLNSRKLCMLRKRLVDIIRFNLNINQPDSPPYRIRNTEEIEQILQCLKDTPQYEELRYIVNKLT